MEVFSEDSKCNRLVGNIWTPLNLEGHSVNLLVVLGERIIAKLEAYLIEVTTFEDLWWNVIRSSSLAQLQGSLDLPELIQSEGFIIDVQVFEDVRNLLVWFLDIRCFSQQLLKVREPRHHTLFWAVSRDLALLCSLPSRYIVNNSPGLAVLLGSKSCFNGASLLLELLLLDLVVDCIQLIKRVSPGSPVVISAICIPLGFPLCFVVVSETYL